MLHQFKRHVDQLGQLCDMKINRPDFECFRIIEASC